MRLSIYDRVTARVSLRLLTAIILLSTFSLPAWATGGLFSSMTQITEPTPVASDYFGYGSNSGVAFSADGLTALVAACYATVGTTSYAGKAYIYHYANGAWTLSKEIDDPDATAGNQDYFGYSLALNADGTVALIGSYAYVSGQSYAGKAYVYTLSNGTWTQTHEFDDPAATADDYFGASSLSLSADGKTAGIGAYCTTVSSQSCAGEAYIFSESNGTWTQAAALPSPDVISDVYYGYPVSISGDGKSVLVGSEAAVSGQNYAGKAYLFTLSNGTWSQAKEFDDPAATADDYFGDTGVALSMDGKTAIIGAECITVNSKSCAGEAYIYTASNGSWTQTAAIPDPDASQYDYFSFPVSISADGKSVLIGSEALVGTSGSYGKAYLYKVQSNGSWMQAKEFDDPAAASGNEDYFGESGVALSSDGEAAFISAYDTTVNSLSYAGAAYIYQSPDDISVALSASPASVTTGQNVALDATITNKDSAVTAYNVVLTGTLPAGLSYASSSAAGGTCSASGQTVTCTLASLAPGANWQPSITGSAGSTGTLTANATVASNEPDPSSTNNSASASVSVKAPVTPPSSGGGGGGAFGLLGLLMLGLPLLGRRRRK
jgi:uncharacterized repeat protein (TIGR01451 family)/MYXO-CTERM domain-containing protein